MTDDHSPNESDAVVRNSRITEAPAVRSAMSSELKCREGFEAWARPRFFALATGREGNYTDLVSDAAWNAWQAAWNRRSPIASDDARDAAESEFEVHLTMAGTDDEMVAAATSGPRARALAEALNYARQYEEEGTVQVYEVTRTPIGGAAATVQEAL